MRDDIVHEEDNMNISELDDTASMRRFIFDEPAVIRRLEQRSTFEGITSNGTVAAAVMVFAAILAVIVANSSAYETVMQIIEAPFGIVLGPYTL
ncbi:MAG: hypothetical protein U0J70_11170, partial [Atopobiaceae bacterium]|nr:hypothetical protein [Atopobiaceae bacterium]